MSATSHVLIVEDDPQLVRILQAVLKQLETGMRVAGTGRQALQSLLEQTPAIVLLDMHLPDMSGMDVLREMRSRGIPATVIAMTAHGSVDLAVEAMREGAYDFLTKPLDYERVRIMVRNALERHRMIEELDDYRGRYERTKFRGLRGSSPVMQRLYRQIRSVAPGSSPVLFLGDAGTELRAAARALHGESPRGSVSFVVVDAASLDAPKLDEAIAGAGCGSLLVENVDRLSPAGAEALGRVLRNAACAPRILASSDGSLKKAVESGRFDEDLYAALGVTTIRLPRLRDRGEDILDLAGDTLHRLAREAGRRFESLADDVEVAFMSYPWPANSGELEEVLRGIVESGDGRVVTRQMLPAAIAACAPDHGGPGIVPMRGLQAANAIRPLWRLESEEIERALQLCEGSVLHAARLLEVSPGTVYRKLQGAKARASG